MLSDSLRDLISLEERVSLGHTAAQERTRRKREFDDVLEKLDGTVVRLDGIRDVLVKDGKLVSYAKPPVIWIDDIDKQFGPTPTVFRGADAAEFNVPEDPDEPDPSTVLVAGPVKDRYDYPDGCYICRSTVKPEYWVAWTRNHRGDPVAFAYIDNCGPAYFETAHEAASALYDEGKGPASYIQPATEFPSVVGVAEPEKYEFEDGSVVRRGYVRRDWWFALTPDAAYIRPEHFDTSHGATVALGEKGFGPKAKQHGVSVEPALIDSEVA